GGNAGIAREFECINLKSNKIVDCVQTIKRLQPKLVVVGPEWWLEQGIKNALSSENIAAFGPTKNAALLESSKNFMKQQCAIAGVKTAQYKLFDDPQKATGWIHSLEESPLVIKLDGLCSGKGVYVAPSKSHALEHIDYLFNEDGLKNLGVTRPTFIVEKFIKGHEVSVFGLCDGNNAVLFSPLQDYKRLLDNDKGPNTGGMGAIAFLGENQPERVQFLERVKNEIFLPILRLMASQGTPFQGLLYAGLMLEKDDINLLEFNVRFGDPETQALMFALKHDIYPLLHQIAHNEAIDHKTWQNKLIDCEQAVCVVLASESYPAKTQEHCLLSLPQNLPDDTHIFFASTSFNQEGCLQAQNGRVMSVTSKAHSIEEARAKAYQAISKIQFMGMQYRTDIGTNMSQLF
ncbi:MAG: phosphoribosylamine--glycine ligase, partial [Myxococcales bacterium]|nr:phosphoribosylamine--glycine ligase [Myxococcales bacterium]